MINGIKPIIGNTTKTQKTNTKNGLLMTMAINRYSTGMWNEIL